jgi:hypothetical protein
MHSSHTRARQSACVSSVSDPQPAVEHISQIQPNRQPQNLFHLYAQCTEVHGKTDRSAPKFDAGDGSDLLNAVLTSGTDSQETKTVLYCERRTGGWCWPCHRSRRRLRGRTQPAGSASRYGLLRIAKIKAHSWSGFANADRIAFRAGCISNNIAKMFSMNRSGLTHR